MSIGAILYGNCDGRFGRDHYPLEGARIEAIGNDWIVVRVDNRYPTFASFEGVKQLHDFIMRNSRKPEEP